MAKEEFVLDQIMAVGGRFGREVWPSEKLPPAHPWCRIAWAGYIVERLGLFVSPPGPTPHWEVKWHEYEGVIGQSIPIINSGYGPTLFEACLDLLERWPMDADSPFITAEEAAEIAEAEKEEGE